MRIAFLLALCAPIFAQQYRAYWADGFNRGFKSPSEVEQMLEDVTASRANAIFMQARLRGNSFYLNSLEPLAEDRTWAQSFDSLQYLIERAHARGIEVHAWFTISPLWFATAPPQDPKHVWHAHGPHIEGRDNWMTYSSTGRVSNYIDLGHPDAFAHIIRVIMHVVAHYDIDGVHLDYIRYPEPASGSGDFGYNATALERFNRQNGRSGTPPSRDPAWTDFRRRQVTQFVRQVYLRVLETKPQVKVSGALIAWGNGPLNDAEYRTRDAYASVYQDWRSWLEEGILDLALPMNYFAEPRNGALFDRWIEYQKDRQFNRLTLLGLGNYLSPIAGSTAQLERALAPSRAGNRAAGVAFYSYANTNLQDTQGRPLEPNAGFYRAAANIFGDTYVPPPDLPWKSKPTRGAILGNLNVDSASHLQDHRRIRIESDTGSDFVLETTTDSTGFFGAIELPPDRYRVRLFSGDTELFRATPQDVAPGQAVRFDIFLKPEDFPR